jgi:uncharacterized protein (DUF2252 family)
MVVGPDTATNGAQVNRSLTRAERIALGKEARRRVPRESHARFETSGREPIPLLLEQAESRVPELVPIRHGRMAVSPFAYFRGAALPMAADLARTPSAGIDVQLCGDAHLSNFGGFASPERKLVFDVNDFDETLPGPFEWDVKRLCASLAVAGRDNGFSDKARRRTVLAAATAYRTAVRTFAERPVLDVWYVRADMAPVLEQLRASVKAKRFKATSDMMARARTRDSMQAQRKLTVDVGGLRKIVSSPPTVLPVEEVFGQVSAEDTYSQIRSVLGEYTKTLRSDRRHLVDEFALVQAARKVVGVGSVGTRAWILLMTAGDGTEPLFLQAKEAQPSVLARFCGRSKYENQGERVVDGQHLMQADSDIFLGWTRVEGPDGVVRDYYVRQLRDWKTSVPIERMSPAGMAFYARLCGWTLARAHARSGDRVALGAYLGGSQRFDEAIADFAEAYAQQNEADHAAFSRAVAEGRIASEPGV